MAKLASAPPTTEDPFDGTSYRLVRSLARGGMGQVFLVEHRRLGRQFVAKLLHDELASNPQLVDRFRIEAQSLGRLRHPNIVSIFGFESTRDKRPFMVTEYLQGRTIAQELASGTVFSVREAIGYARETLAALSVAHDLGIIHRDIKPQNLMLHELPDGTKQIKVLDFGLARVIPGISQRAPQPLNVPTDTGVVFGTPHFVSPEAALGQHVDHRADIYGVGLVLYVMLARRGPFDHAIGHVEAMAAHLAEEPAAPSKIATKISIPPVLDAIVLKALAKEVDSRIQTAQEFIALLGDVASTPYASLDSSIRVLAKVEHGSIDKRDDVPSHSMDLRVDECEPNHADSRISTFAWLILIGAAILAAVLVFSLGKLLLTGHGAPWP